ncbi:MAG: ExbD/TolR family protein [Flavipsychrobacter sp.]
MANVQLNQNKGTRGRRSPSIDLTPMVDLGFILITFFIYTTSIAEPRMMDINMPFKPATEGTAYVDTATITIIPTKNHLYATYTGTYRDGMQFNTYAAAQLRNVILDKKYALKKLPATFSEQAHKLHVIIKPNDDCEYQDVVTLLDEMAINQVAYYAIADITANEKLILTKQLQ